MKFIISVIRVSFLFVIFFLVGLFLAVLFLSSVSPTGQVFVALVLAIVLTYWLESRRSKRDVISDGKLKRRGRKAKARLKSSSKKAGKPEHLLHDVRKPSSSGEFRSHDPETTGRNYSIETYPLNGTSAPEQEVEIPKEDQAQPSRSFFRKNQPSGWIAKSKSATVAGRNIGDLLYVGPPPRLDSGGYNETVRGYIDPGLSVAKSWSDMAGDKMPYWPSYSEISPRCRAKYLDWLAGGRTDAFSDIGCIFLFFYGLERRFFIDIPNTDANDIVDEVTRLRELYPENRSVQRYLGEFLDATVLSEHDLANIKPRFDATSWDVPFSLQYAIGAKITRGENLDADWLLSWFLSHAESALRTPAERCREEFLALFKVRFEIRFPDDLKINKPRKQLSVEYRAASGEFRVEVNPTLDGKSVPDITSLRKPIEIAQEIADEVMEDLDKLSRYLGRNKDGRGSMEAHALLPHELWAMFPSESFKQLETWASSVVETGGLVPVLEVVERLEGTRPEKLTKKNLTGVADALARIGFGMAPDPRFALRSPKLNEPVVIFELGESVVELENVSTQYRAALIEVAVSSFVVHADGRVRDIESTSLFDKVRNVQGLSAQELRRLEANLTWMLAVAPDLPLLRRKLKDSGPETISAVRAALVAAAYADGTIQSEEVASIEKVYKTLGLDPGLVYSDLHAGEVQGGPVTVRAAESAAKGEVIPVESQSGIPQLDVSRIAAIRSDTDRVSSVLGEIFSETPDVVSENPAQHGVLNGLDDKHTKLVQKLIGKEAWTDDEVQNLCEDLGLMVSGAIETVNEWAFEVYDEALVDEYEGFEVASEPAELLNKKFVEES